jgi:hypothetical protein
MHQHSNHLIIRRYRRILARTIRRFSIHMRITIRIITRIITRIILMRIITALRRIILNY